MVFDKGNERDSCCYLPSTTPSLELSSALTFKDHLGFPLVYRMNINKRRRVASCFNTLKVDPDVGTGTNLVSEVFVRSFHLTRSSEPDFSSIMRFHIFVLMF